MQPSKAIKTIVILFSSAIIFANCSKSNDTKPDLEKPVVPPAKDSTATKDSNTLSNVRRDTIIYQNFEVTEFPILRKSFADSIALGMYTTNTNSLLSAYPNVTILDNKYWNMETIYTSAIGDSFHMDALPNKENQYTFIQHYLKADHAFKQWVGSSVASNSILNGRFNELRSYLGTKEDVKDLFGLDKSDTSFIDTTYKRMVYTMEATKFNVTIEKNPSGPDNYSNIKNGTSDWTKYYGQENPYFIDNIDFGYGITMVFESKNIEKISATLSNLFNQPLSKLKNGTAISSLSTEDQTILNDTKFYGFKLGIGKIESHKVSDGILDAYTYISKVTDDDNFVGYPIRYLMNGYKKSDPSLKLSFSLAHYTTYLPTKAK